MDYKELAEELVRACETAAMPRGAAAGERARASARVLGIDSSETASVGPAAEPAAPAVPLCQQRWLASERLEYNDGPIGDGTTIINERIKEISDKLAFLAAGPAASTDLGALRALVSQIRQLQKLGVELPGQAWNAAVQCERRALTAHERLKLACTHERQKEPVAEAIIIYLTQLVNSLK